MQGNEWGVQTLTKNFEHIQQKIAEAAHAAKRNASEIDLLAVSKGQPAEKILALHLATKQSDFGENYTQELLQKAQALTTHPDLRWHFIGQLQSNKISKLVPIVSSIQSVASEKHLNLIAQHALAHHKSPFPIYLAVNAGNEEAKAGLTMADAVQFGRHITKDFKDTILLEGIMSIPPSSYNDEAYPSAVPALYKDLYDCAKQVGAGRLSLGMSSDLSLAIRSGSSCIRIGTAIFGARS